MTKSDFHLFTANIEKVICSARKKSNLFFAVKIPKNSNCSLFLKFSHVFPAPFCEHFSLIYLLFDDE